MKRSIQFLRSTYEMVVGELIQQGRKLAVGGLGKPACGKGTQADILNNAGVPTQRSSGILDELGMQHPLNQLRCSGRLIPARDMASLVVQKLAARGNPDLIYLDGSPRAVEELDLLRSGLEPAGYEMLIVHFDIPDDLAIERRIQQLAGGEARPDAGKERDRLAEYAKKTLPVIDRAAELGVLVRTVPINEKTEAMHLAFQVLGKISRAVFCTLPTATGAS